MNNKIFPDDNITCTQPWDSIRILGTGHVQPCGCMGTRGYPAMTDAGSDFYEHWRSSDEIQGIRSRIQNGIKEARCSRCYEEESVSKTSFRGRFNAQTAVYAGPHFRDSLEQNPIWTRMQDLTIKDKAMPAHITLFWGNTCNSRCLMCTPLNSAEVAKDYRDFGYDFEEFGLRGREDELCASFEWPVHEHGESRYQSILNMIVNNDRLIYLKQKAKQQQLN
jgi:MoaA/NifB/PqqE/SkfB family radical SAM enzyme